jgi:RNA polymerase sigma factor (TIGR02999 family)
MSAAASEESVRWEEATTDALFPVVYDELKRMARRHLRAVRGRATICTTELVHETFLRLSHRDDVSWDDRAHFFGSAARAMRQVLVAFARHQFALKRQGDRVSLSIADADGVLEAELDEILSIDDALSRLDRLNPRLRQIVELRFFGGLPQEQVAALLGVSVRTVERDWFKAKLFLLRELEGVAC